MVHEHARKDESSIVYYSKLYPSVTQNPKQIPILKVLIKKMWNTCKDWFQ